MGWNQSTGSRLGNSERQQSSKRGKSRRLTLWAIGAVVIVVAVVAIVMLCSRDERIRPAAEKPRPTAPLAEVKPSLSTNRQPEEVESPEAKAKRERIEKLRGMTKAERFDFIYNELKNKPLDLTPTTNKPFRTGVEKVMSWIFTTRLGDLPPPLPNIPIRDEAHMAEILIADNPVLDGDSEKIKEAKKMVELAKKELRAYLKEGGDVQSFLEYYRGQLVQAHMERSESYKSLGKIVREDPGLAGDYLREVNAKLREKGIRPIQLSAKQKETLGIVEEEPEPESQQGGDL